MPTQFKKTVDGVVEIMQFTRFHLSEVTGKRVKTKQEMPDDTVDLTLEQAHMLIDKWNADDYLFYGGGTPEFSM